MLPGQGLAPGNELGRRAFDEAQDDSGYARSSVWGEMRGGLVIDRGEKLSGEVSLGYRREDLEDARLEDLNVLLANAAILALVRSARPGPESGETGSLIAWGPGPRASQALMLAVRARALLDGRLAPSIDDVLDLAEPVLKHRMALTFSARAEGKTISDVIRQLKTRIG